MRLFGANQGLRVGLSSQAGTLGKKNSSLGSCFYYCRWTDLHNILKCQSLFSKEC